MFIKSALCCTQSSLPTPCETYHDCKWKYQLTKISKLTLNRTSDQVKWTSSSVTFVILDSLHEICSVGKRTGEQLVCVHLKINWRNQCYKCLTAYIQLFRERLSEKMCTRQPRKVIWDIINILFLTTVVVKPTFVPFHQHSWAYVHGHSCHSFKFLWRIGQTKPPTIPFRIVVSTFFWQPFSKQLYTCNV